jgi:tetratricopeptide (TPR) repeat protein
MNGFHIFLLFIIIIVLFSPSLSGGFLWDDEHLIVYNPAVKSLKNIPLAFGRSFFYKSHESPNITYYRPLVTVINTLQYALFGLRPFWWHLFNLVLHAVNAILFYYFMIKILNIERKVSFWAALFFGIHSVHAEAVCFISGRTDIIALFFILASLLLYFKGNGGHWIYRPASIFFFILGLLSKELVLMFPLALTAVEYVRSAESSTRTWFKKDFAPLMKSLIPYFAAGALYVIIRFAFVKGIEMPYYPTGRLVTTWLTMPKVFLRYLLLIVSIGDTLCDYTNFFRIETSLFSFSVLAPLFVILAMTILTLWLFLKKHRVFTGIFWFLIFLFPVLNILPLGIWMSERYLYISFLGISIILTSLEKKFKIKFIPLYAILFMIVVCGIATIQRSFMWQDAETLWSHAIKRNPDNPQARVIYAEILFSRGRYDEAEKELEQVKPIDIGGREILPDSLTLTKAQTLVKIYMAKKEYEKAKEWLIKAEKILPLSANTAALKGKLFLEQGNYEKAKEAFEYALGINPELLSALSGLMESKDKLKEPPEEILSLAEKAIWINPDYALPYLYRGKLQGEKDELEKARLDFETFIRLEPDAPEGYLFLADIHEKMARKDKTFFLKAMKTYDALLMRHPDNIEGLNNLGILFAITGEKQKAEELWKRVLSINPDDYIARENLRKLYEASNK